MTLDDLRTQRPELGLALYAYAPGGGVTLEVHSDGAVFTFDAATEAAAIERAFPSFVVSQASAGGGVAVARVSNHPPLALADAAETASIFD